MDGRFKIGHARVEAGTLKTLAFQQDTKKTYGVPKSEFPGIKKGVIKGEVKRGRRGKRGDKVGRGEGGRMREKGWEDRGPKAR